MFRFSSILLRSPKRITDFIQGCLCIVSLERYMQTYLHDCRLQRFPPQKNPFNSFCPRCVCHARRIKCILICLVDEGKTDLV